jgi:tetratricopeptide (TPR) repeat protein
MTIALSACDPAWPRPNSAWPADAALRAQLGYYYGRIGDPDQASRYLSEALAAGPEMLYVQYFVGVSAADKGDRETALRAVTALVRLGYPPTLLRSAPEFRSLLQDAEYKKIIGELRPFRPRRFSESPARRGK